VRFIIGAVQMGEVSGPLTRVQYEAGRNRHGLSETYDVACALYGGKERKLWAWTVKRARAYEWPVPFQASTAVRWPAMKPPRGATWTKVQDAARGAGPLAMTPEHRTKRVRLRERAEEVTPAARRARTTEGTYSETRQRQGARAPKRPREEQQRCRAVRSIEMSHVAVDAVVDGRYDWRDSALRRRTE